jgi:hypothetical protein
VKGRSVPATRWWFDGAVRGLVLGVLYPFAVALVAVVSEGLDREAVGTAGLVVVLGSMLGAVVGPVVGLVVGLLCSVVHPLARGRWSRRATALAVISACLVVGTFAVRGNGAPSWWLLLGGPALIGAGSLLVWPLDEPEPVRLTPT